MKQPLPNSRSRIAKICLASALSLSAIAPGARSSVTDESAAAPVLTIGGFKVSEACVDMNFMSYAKSSGAALSADQVHAWVRDFVKRQVLTAEALNEGYGMRPEIASELRQMEEHMLTDSNGPLYGMLVQNSPEPCTPDQIYERGETTYQLEVIEVPIDAPAHSMVSEFLMDRENEATGMEAMRRTGQVDILQGPFTWPFEPFEAEAEVIEHAPIGRWQAVDDCRASVLFRVISTSRTPEPPRQKVQTLLERMATHCALDYQHHKREAELMASGSLGFDWDAAETIIVNLKAAKPDAGSNLTPGVLGLPSDRVLAHLDSLGGRQTVSVGDVIGYYNSQFIRRLPKRPIDVYDLVKEFLMFRRDLSEARRLGLDKAGDFPEHRNNYRNELILGLYEAEQVLPKLNLSRAAAEDFYRNHLADYVRPTRIKGRIYTFESANDAAAFAKAASNPAWNKDGGNLPYRVFVAAPQSAYASVPPLCHFIFSPAKPKVVGPMPGDDRWIVWIYDQTLDSAQASFASVEPQIIRTLRQPMIGPYEDRLAHALAARLSVNNRISEDRLRAECRQHSQST